MVCSTTVAIVTNLIAALTNSDRQQTQALAAQLISSAPLPCRSAEREELSINLEELQQEQQEEQEAILELENQLDALVVTIRQLEEKVEALTSQLVDQLGVQIDGGVTVVQVDDSGEVPLILQ